MTTATVTIPIGDERFRKIKIDEPEPETSNPELHKLEMFYERHKKSVKKWRDKNKETLKDKQKTYLENLRKDPERYNSHLEKRRNYYNNVLMPRKKQRLEEKHEAKQTTLVI
jgi:hypothetical protein